MKKKLARFTTFLVVLSLVIAMSACLPRKSEANLNSSSDSSFEVTCEHEITWDGSSMVKENDAYYYAKSCSLCGESVLELAQVVSVSDTWLYDTTDHWNIVKCEEYELDGSVDGETGEENRVKRTKNYKLNNAEHDLDENGICSVCSYKNTQSEGLEYEESEDGEGYIVTGLGECEDEHINIPANHNGRPVVGVGDGAFKRGGKKNPAGGEEAPGDSSSEEGGVGEDQDGPRVVGITIPDTVIYISCTAFSDCENLNNFIVDAANQIFASSNNCLIDMMAGSIIRGCEFSVIPEDGSVTVIGAYAFANLSGLVTINIPESIEEIGDKAFFECEALVEVNMPENVNTGVDVFRGSIHVEIVVRHNLRYVRAQEATCESAGNIDHFYCEDCGNFYADQGARERIYDVTIPASHNFVNGVCEKCGLIQSEILIVSVDQVADLGKFPLGTLEDAIGLPLEINVYTKDGLTHKLPVVWDLSAYDKSTSGAYTLKGVIQAGNFHFAEDLSNVVETTIEIVEIMNGTADIVFVLDISGSMEDEVTNVINNIIAFSQAIESMGVSARWGAITYSDFTVSGPNEDSVIIKNGASDWFTSAADYKAAVSKFKLAYGGDGPETAIDGLMLANTMTTRKDARVFYILLTDADCKVTNNYGVGSIYECATILAGNSINTSVITDTYYYSEYQAFEQLTGGIITDIYGQFSKVLLDKLVPIIYGEVIA